MICPLALTLIVQPVGALEIPSPAQTWPRLSQTLGFVGMVDPRLSPRALRRPLAPWGLDPLASDHLEALGIDLAKPLTVHVWPEGRIVVYSAQLGSAKRFASGLDRITKRRPWIASSPRGLIFGRSPPSTVAVVRDKKRVFVQIGERARGTPAGPPTAIEGGAWTKPMEDARVRPVQRVRTEARTLRVPRCEGPNDIRFDFDGRAPVDHVRGRVGLTAQGFEGCADIVLTVGSDLVASEVVSARRAARSLITFEGERPVAELTVAFTNVGLTRALERLGLEARAARALRRDLQVILFDEGQLAVAALLSKKKTRLRVDALESTIARRWAKPRTLRKDGLWVAWFGALDPKTLKIEPAPEPSKKAPAVSARARPDGLWDAIERLVESVPGLGVGSLELEVLGYAMEGFLSRSSEARFSARVRPARIEVQGLVEHGL